MTGVTEVELLVMAPCLQEKEHGLQANPYRQSAMTNPLPAWRSGLGFRGSSSRRTGRCWESIYSLEIVR